MSNFKPNYIAIVVALSKKEIENIQIFNCRVEIDVWNCISNSMTLFVLWIGV